MPNEKSLKERIAERLQDIKLILKLEAAPLPAPAPIEPVEQAAQNTGTLKDGTEVRWTGDLAEGVELTMVTPAGIIPATDGELEMTDGTILTCVGGKVTKVTAAVAPDQGNGGMDMTKMAADLDAKFSTEIEALKVSFSEVKTANEAEILSLKTALSSTLELVKELNDTPISKVDKPINANFSSNVEKEEKNRELFRKALQSQIAQPTLNS